MVYLLYVFGSFFGSSKCEVGLTKGPSQPKWADYTQPVEFEEAIDK